jgi:hypothetical protein
MLGTKVKVRRKSWTAIRGGWALVMIAGLALASCRKNPALPAPANLQPVPDAQRPVVKPTESLVWMKSTSPIQRTQEFEKLSSAKPEYWYFGSSTLQMSRLGE